MARSADDSGVAAARRRGGFRAAALLWAALALAGAALALAPNYPALTGRIVDDAAIIPAETAAALEQKLAGLEQKSGIQLVVATVPSLGGDEIEPYANGLFRAWKLGEKDKNNGALLLIAPNQRKVRIEVGYGLEGTLTDALSKIIISNAIAPRFKAGDYGAGVARGVDDIIAVLTTDAAEWQKRPDLRLDRRGGEADALDPWIALALFLFVVFLLSRMSTRGQRGRWGNYGGWGGFSSGGFSGGGFSGGGFSGGGGSSGGGGASGSW